MRHIDDAAAGEYRGAFHTAAKRSLQRRASEGFSVSGFETGLRAFHMKIGALGDDSDSPINVLVTDDPEGAILTAVEEWWADRSQYRRRNGDSQKD
jgi:hypothetical protein